MSKGQSARISLSAEIAERFAVEVGKGREQCETGFVVEPVGGKILAEWRREAVS